MPEFELIVLQHQFLDGLRTAHAMVGHEVAAWVALRNATGATIA